MRTLQHAIDNAIGTLPTDDDIDIPHNLVDQIRQTIDGTAIPWDDAVWELTHHDEKNARPSHSA